jgi:hypothetical protein
MARRLVVLRCLRRWHARVGITATLFFLVLAGTGVGLNHGDDLRLDGRHVHFAWLARWYGRPADAPLDAFRSGRHELAAANGRWSLDGRVFGERLPQPVGLAELPDLFVVASRAALYVYRDDGVLVERMEQVALPGMPLQAVASAGGTFFLKTASGTFASADAMSWRRTEALEISWSRPVPLSGTAQRRYAAALLPGISVQRLLLDLHSGRFFGRFGTLFVDLLAALLAVLSLIGGWLFFRPRHRRERQ